jgi:hypothetical protein
LVVVVGDQSLDHLVEVVAYHWGLSLQSHVNRIELRILIIVKVSVVVGAVPHELIFFFNLINGGEHVQSLCVPHPVSVAEHVRNI